MNLKTLILIFFIQLQLYSQNQVVAEVNGEKILLKDITAKLLIANFNQTLEELIEEKLLLQEAKKRNIILTDDEFNTFIDSIKKRFASDDEFKKEIKRINLTEKEYYQIIKNRLLADKALLALLNINITDEDAKRYYDQNPHQFIIPQAFKLRQIFVLSEKEAEDIMIALDAGADFIKLASIKNANENLKQNAGDIGYISKGMLAPEIEKEIFSTPKGSYTKPLKIGDGYSIIMVEDIREEKTISFDEAKDFIKNTLTLSLVNANRKKLLDSLKNSAKIDIKK